MPKFDDLTNQIFTNLTAIEVVGRDKKQGAIWRCRCACGNTVDVRATNLKTGNTKGCGCLTGQRVGHYGIDIKQRFMTYVQRTANCWEWQGTKNKQGYGSYWSGSDTVRAHRLSYELFIGPIQIGLYVCHKCDNPSCVNPDHLFLGTALDNIRDCINKGRFRTGGGFKVRVRGEQVAKAKMTTEKIIKIRKQYASGMTQDDLAKQFGIAQSTVHQIVRRVTWRHVY